MSGTTLFEEFPEVTTRQWKQQIQSDLRGADYNEALVWQSAEGIPVKPFYNHEDLRADNIPLIHRSDAWLIGQSIEGTDSALVSKNIKDSLALGTEALILTLTSEDAAIRMLGEVVDREPVPLFLDAQFLSLPFIRNLYNAHPTQPENLHLCIDPIGFLARTGNWYVNKNKDLGLVSDVLKQFNQAGLGSILGVDGGLYQQAGATIVQQLAYSLAHAHDYIHHLQPTEVTASSACNFTFKLAIGGDYFFEIAKIRALRALWRTVSAAYGWHPECRIIACPSFRNKTVYDYNTNLIRTSMECMSAILGGADVVYNLPYDAMYLERNDFSERIARNQLLILKHEGLMERPLNPADGSYYIENLTRQLAEKSLELFKDIEAGGGFLKLLGNHTIHRKIKESAGKEATLFSKGDLILTGTNLHINKADRMKNSIEKSPFLVPSPRKTLIEPISVKRLAEEVEQSRLKHE